MTLKLLAVGDLHIGRRPSRLPPTLADEAAALAPARAWQHLVELAVERRVDLVALAGDVVEREDDFFEAYRELSDGVRTLAGAGIRVVGIAGNHDVKVLPRLADQLDGFELIGRGGRFERIEHAAGGERLTLHGWSFPQVHVTRSPLADATFERGAGLNLGLLHCDRDQSRSRYAPVSSRELRAAPLDGWLLGHIHAPDPLTAAAPSGYLGCVSGMDPNEAGDRGPWLVEVEGGRVRAVTQWVLAPLRWDHVELDLTDLAEPAAARARLTERLRALDEQVAAALRAPSAAGLRITLTGRTRHAREVQALLARDERAIVFDGAAGTRYFVARCVTATRPEIALDELARRNDPPGLLARRLLLLDTPDDAAARQLIDTARARLEAQRRDRRWQALEAEPLDDAAVVGWLRHAGGRLLEDMLAQQAVAPE